jgi:hypothetical protein
VFNRSGHGVIEAHRPDRRDPARGGRRPDAEAMSAWCRQGGNNYSMLPQPAQ